MSNLHTRRAFLGRGLTVLSAAYTLPHFVQRTVYALNDPNDAPLTQTKAGRGDERILIVVQLSGGNDGLSTVIPTDNDDYRKARPQLAITKDTLALDAKRGVVLNPKLKAFKSLYDAGELAVVQGVGYPNPNRSHFRSMEIWHSADPVNPPRDGWLGKYFDAQCAGADPVDPKMAIALGNSQPLAVHGSKFSAVSFQKPEAYQWFAGNTGKDGKKAFATLNNVSRSESDPGTGNPTLDFLERVALDAQLSSDEIRRVTTNYRGGVTYPDNDFGRSLQMVAQMIAGKLSTRVYYVSYGGFDTHTNERQQHDRLMENLSAGLGALMQDLKNQGNDKRVMVMTFSEFGRRVSENASGGTDHGTAAPLFVMGGNIKGGVFGEHPSLRPADLDHGDLKFHTDFRSVYATILDKWLNTNSQSILNGNFKHLAFV